MVIAQFWAFANDLFTPEQGKRLFPLIGVGSSLGRVGRARCARDSSSRTWGPLRLLVGGGVILVVCVLLARVVSRVARGRSPPACRPPPTSRSGKEGGFELIRKDRYLMLIAALTVLLNVVNTSGEYLFGRYVVEQANALYGAGADAAAARERFIGETYSQLFSTVNLVGFLLQMFVVSRAVQVPRRRASRSSSTRSWRWSAI